jgi:putative FmdB family regulatory protein
MPIYEYDCEECGHGLELILSITSKRKKRLDCPECDGKKTLVRVISKVNFVINGANAKNSYYIPPTNEALGLPSERTLRKKMESEYYMEELSQKKKLTSAEKEVIDTERKEKKEREEVADKKYKYLKEKYKEVSDPLEKAFKKVKDKHKDLKYRNMTPKERGLKGTFEVGTRTTKIEVDQPLIEVPSVIKKPKGKKLPVSKKD